MSKTAVLIFAGFTVGFEKFVEQTKKVQHMGNFNDLLEYVFDMFILYALSFLMTNFFEDRLIKRKRVSKDAPLKVKAKGIKKAV